MRHEPTVPAMSSAIARPTSPVVSTEALTADQVEHVGEGRVGREVTGFQRRAVLPGHDPQRLRVAAEEGVGGEGQVARGGRPDRVAVQAGPSRRLDDSGPRQRPELLDGQARRR